MNKGFRLRLFCVFFYFFAILSVFVRNDFMIVLILYVWFDGFWNWHKVRVEYKKAGCYDSLEPWIWPLIVFFEWQTFDKAPAIQTGLKFDFDLKPIIKCHKCFCELELVETKKAICLHFNYMPVEDSQFLFSTQVYCPHCDVRPHDKIINCQHRLGRCPLKNCPYRN